MFDKTLLAEETRKNAKEILSVCKGAFRMAHAIYGFDFTKTFEVIKGTDKFTYKSIVKQIEQKYCVEDCNIIIYIDMYLNKSLYSVYMNKSKKRFETDYTDNYVMANRMDLPCHFWTKNAFEEIRKQGDYNYYVLIQSKSEQAEISHAFLRSRDGGYGNDDLLSGCYSYSNNFDIPIKKGHKVNTRELRYKAAKKSKYMIHGYPCFFKADNKRMLNEIRLDRMDKSGYFKTFNHYEYNLRAKALKEKKYKAEADNFDYTAELRTLESSISSAVTLCNTALQRYCDVLLKPTSPAIISEQEYNCYRNISFPSKLERALIKYAYLQYGLKAKKFSYPEQISNAFKEINHLLDAIEAEVNTVTERINSLTE